MKKVRRLFKHLYDLLPLKKQLLQLLKALGCKSGFTKHFYFTGPFSFNVKNKKIVMFNPGYLSHIENQIFWQGIENGWEKNSVDIWLKLSEKANVILDVGANTGIFSLLSKAVNESAQVISFEPIHFIADKFIRNMELNHFSYELYQIALSNKKSNVDVYSESLNNSYTIAIDQKNIKGKIKKYNKLNIKTLRLDEFIEMNNIPKIDLIKIDVERHEPMVLEGMGKYLKQMKPDLLIEIQTEEIAAEIQRLVKDINYLYFNIDDIGDVTQTSTIQKSAFLNYLLCSEKSAEALDLIEQKSLSQVSD